MIAERLKCEVGAVGKTVDVPILDAEGDPQIGDIRRTFCRVLGGQVYSFAGKAVTTGANGGVALLRSRRILPREGHRLCIKLVELDTGEKWIGLERSPLTKIDHVAIQRPLQGGSIDPRSTARSTGKIDDGVWLRIG